MTLTHILAFSILALLLGAPSLARWRVSGILAASVAALYWLQPALPIRHLDFWLPTLSLGVTALVWAITQRGQLLDRAGSRRDVLVAITVLVLLAFTRYLPGLCCLTPTAPPQVQFILLALVLFGGAGYWLAQLRPQFKWPPNLALGALLGLFIILKSEPLAQVASQWLRQLSGQNPALASAFDIRWLGYSYLAFRLLHTLRDHQSGKLPPLTFGEFVSYALFFPALTAGPIDRVGRFVAELRQPGDERRAQLSAGAGRLVQGLFKKFVLADSLALFALNPQNAVQTQTPGWTWILLYAYALRLYYDFSGYTDIALGLGRFAGIRLPENFSAPYLQANLTAFWNSWHITLAQWFRAYFFNPLTRALRGNVRGMPAWRVVLIGQTGTLLLIGLWHGLTLSFAVWGVWHALGLFAHNRWTELMRRRFPGVPANPVTARIVKLSSVAITFHYVTLGWVWFVMPDVQLAWRTLLKLFGSGN